MKKLTLVTVLIFAVFAAQAKKHKKYITNEFVLKEIEKLKSRGIDTFFAISTNCVHCISKSKNRLYVYYADEDSVVHLKYYRYIESAGIVIDDVKSFDRSLFLFYNKEKKRLLEELNSVTYAYDDTTYFDGYVGISSGLNHGLLYNIFINQGAEESQYSICCSIKMNGDVYDKTRYVFLFISMMNNYSDFY